MCVCVWGDSYLLDNQYNKFTLVRKLVISTLDRPVGLRMLWVTINSPKCYSFPSNLDKVK